MESSFDSDRFNSRTPLPEESDIETQLLAEQDNVNKQETIEKLQKELSICRAQFDQSVAINKKVESVYSKNQKMTTALRLLSSEKDEISRRLEISLRANEELESKLSDERLMATQQHARDTADKDKEILKIKKECDLKIEEITKHMEALDKEKEKHELSNKMTTNKIERLLQNANQYFGFSHLNFSELDLLTDFLAQPPLSQGPTANSQNPIDIPMQADFPSFSKLERKVKINRQKLRGARKQNVKFENEIEKLQRSVGDAEKKQQSLIKDFECRIEQIKEDQVSNNAESNEKIRELKSVIQNLKTENQKLKAENKEFKAQQLAAPNFGVSYMKSIQNPKQVSPQFQSSNNCNTQKQSQSVAGLITNNGGKCAFQEEVDSLNRSNLELSQKLQVAERKREQFASQFNDADAAKMRLEIEIEKYKNALNALKVVHDETLSEVATLRESLHSKCDNQSQRNEKKLSQRLKAQLDHSEHTIKQLSQQVHDLQLEKEQEKHAKDQLETKTKSVKNELEDSNVKLSNLTDELNDIKQQIAEKPSLTAEDIIPTYAWRCSEFDPSLASQVEKVILNPLLQPASKLNNVYKVINRFYNESLKQKEDISQSLSGELNYLKSTINKFIVDLSILLSMKAMTITDFISGHGEEKLMKTITEFVKNYENMKRKDAYHTAIAEQLTNTFGDAPDLHTLVADIRLKMDSLNQKMKLRTKKLRDLKTLVKALRHQTEEEMNSLKFDLDEKTQQNSTLKKNFDTLTDVHQKMKRELQITKAQFSELQNNWDENESVLKESCEQNIENAKAQHFADEIGLRQQVEQLLVDKENTRVALENHESSLDRLREVIKKDQNSIKEKDNIILSLTSERDKIAAQMEEKCRQEKEQLIKSYEKAISEIRQQCDDHRSDLEKVSQEMLCLEKRNKQAKDSIVALKREKIRLESEMKALYDQMKRERQINEADTKNKILSAEAVLSQKFQDSKNKWDNEKRRIFAFAADEFRQHFNPAETMDERAFRALIARIKKELEKLSESDNVVRRLVGAGPRQTTDEAVAQVIMT